VRLAFAKWCKAADVEWARHRVAPGLYMKHQCRSRSRVDLGALALADVESRWHLTTRSSLVPEGLPS